MALLQIFVLRSTAFYCIVAILIAFIGIGFIGGKLIPLSELFPVSTALIEPLLFAGFVVCLIMAIGLHNWRIRKSNQLIAKHGLLAQGRKHWEGFSHKNSDNEEYFKHALYIKGQDGQLHDVSFTTSKTADHLETVQANLTYPCLLFIRYPRVNEEFEVKYMPGKPKYFVILNEGNSEFAQHIAQERLGLKHESLRQGVAAAQARSALDKFNPTALDDLQHKQAELKEFERNR
ncbi:MAG: hypothetical protein Q4G54_01305 [Pelistega sp.]|nr:hypothetical protein [Pelistega sp.]